MRSETPRLLVQLPANGCIAAVLRTYGRSAATRAASPGAPCKNRRPCAPPPSATERSPSRSTPTPSPRRASCSSACAPPASTAPTCCSCKGRYPAPPGAPQDIPGLELAGEVVAVGRGVERFEPGDRVMAIVGGGGQAELAVVHERAAMPVPDELDWAAAGGVPEVFTTAHDALFTQAGLTVGERLLVHGAAGGVGMAAVQLGAMAGARVTATVRDRARREQVARARRQGDRARGLRGRTGPFDVDPRARRRAQPGREPRGARASAAASRDRRRRGREGRARPARADGQARPHPRLDAARPLARGEGATPRGASSGTCCPASPRGDLSVPVAATFPLDAAAEAYERFQAGGKLGKIVLRVP